MTTWTFEVPPTPCPRGKFQNLHPQPLKCNHQYFYQNYEGINMVMACKIKLYYSESDLKYIYESLGIKNYRRLIRIVDLFSLQTHIF